MTSILPWLLLGGRTEAKDLPLLRRHDVRLILNCTPPRTEDPVSGVPHFFESTNHGTPVIRYVRCPIYDNVAQKLQPALDVALPVLEQAQHHGSVLVHCAQGVSRSAAIVIAFLVKHYGISVDAALEYVRQCGRPQVKPNDAFMRELRAFEATTVAQRASGALGPALPLPYAGSTSHQQPTGTTSSTSQASPRQSHAPHIGASHALMGPARRPAPSNTASESVGTKRPRPRQPHALEVEVEAVAAAQDAGKIAEDRGNATPTSTTAASLRRPHAGDAGHDSDGGSTASSRSFVERALSITTAGPEASSVVRGTAAPTVQLPLCEECEIRAAVIRCSACDVRYCRSCDAEAHADARIGSHESARKCIAPRAAGSAVDSSAAPSAAVLSNG